MGFRRNRRNPNRPRPKLDLRKTLFVLPNLITLGSVFSGFNAICLVAKDNPNEKDLYRAAVLLIFAMLFDMMDGRVARMTKTQSAFGLQLDSLADVISFGVAPAILSFAWGLSPLGRLGWAAGFLFVAAAAMRLARFNIQSGGGDKRYFVGLPSPAAAAIPASTVYAWPYGLYDYRAALPAIAMVIVPAALMVSTIRFRSFKTLESQTRRPYTVLIFIAAAIMAIATHPRSMLVVISYSYLASAFIGLAITRLRHRGSHASPNAAPAAVEPPDRLDSAAR